MGDKIDTMPEGFSEQVDDDTLLLTVADKDHEIEDFNLEQDKITKLILEPPTRLTPMIVIDDQTDNTPAPLPTVPFPQQNFPTDFSSPPPLRTLYKWKKKTMYTFIQNTM